MKHLWTAFALVALTACTAEQPAPPKFEDADVCALLQSGDAGNLPVALSRSSRSCDFKFDSLTVRLTLRTEKFADASQPLQSDGGYGAVINDRPMTRRCTDASRRQRKYCPLSPSALRRASMRKWKFL